MSKAKQLDHGDFRGEMDAHREANPLTAEKEPNPFAWHDEQDARIESLESEVRELRIMLLATVETVRILANIENYRIERKAANDKKSVG